MRKVFASALVLTLVITSAEGLRASEPQAKDIVDTAAAAGSFTTLAKALQAAGLIDTSKGVKVDGANVVKTDIACSNGVIHLIDSIILPK